VSGVQPKYHMGIKSSHPSHDDDQNNVDWRLTIKGASFGPPRLTWKIAIKMAYVCMYIIAQQYWISNLQ